MPEEINNNVTAEENDEKKGGNKLDALYMHKADVMALSDKLSALSQKVLDGLVKLHLGEGYSAAEEAVFAFADELLFGTFYDFREKNKWFKGIDYPDLDKLVNNDIGQTPEDLTIAMEMWRVVNGKGGEQFNNVYQYLQEAVNSGFLRQAYRVMRKDILMRDAHNEEILQIINDACEEFYTITSRYTNASICNEIPVKKENPYEVNYELVVNHLAAEIKQSFPLNVIINDKLEQDSAFYNYYTILDSDTKSLTLLPEISKFADEIARIATLDNEVKAYFNGVGKMGTAVCEAIHNVLDYMRFTYAEARDILNNYRYNTQEFPYSLMHYHPYVKRCVESCNTMSLNDPTQNGTKYVLITGSMITRCRKLAQLVAKAAP
ncbi:MAG: hypothetical protein K6E62_08945 [Lachnospiraceae bacterium]|nr:hypothetical protein [Lachnospiraceae bacterium]